MVIDVLDQPHEGRTNAPTRRARRQRTFMIHRNQVPDDALDGLEAELVAGGWLWSEQDDADLVLIDARDGRVVSNDRAGRGHRLLIVDDQREAALLLSCGAGDDAVTLGEPSALRVRLLSARRVIDARRRAASQLGQARRRSLTDPLTGLGNRRALGLELAGLLRRVCAGVPASLLIVDVDHFKEVNDLHGHLVGDTTLSAVAQSLAGELRDDVDSLFRWAGDEFVSLLGECGELEALGVAERLRLAVAELGVGTSTPGAELRVTVSVGVAALPAGAFVTPFAALAAADRGLYAAKRGGRDRVGVGTLAQPDAPAGELDDSRRQVAG
jgi:diguanylate cyclase (GGDEF)-like protein